MSRYLPALVLALACGAFSAFADEPPPPPKPASAVVAEGSLLIFPTAPTVFAELRVAWRHRLFASDNELFSDNFFGGGMLTTAAPDFAQPGVYVELAPTSFLQLRGAYQFVDYFGVLGSLRPLSNCGELGHLSASDARCDFGSSSGPSVADHGHRAWLGWQLQLPIGPFILLHNGTFERWWFRENWAAGEGFTDWLNELYWVPMERDDTLFTASTVLVYDFRSSAPDDALHPLFGIAHDLYRTTARGYLSQRVGVAGGILLPEWRGLRELLIGAFAQWYTNDRYAVGPIPLAGIYLKTGSANFLDPGSR